MMVKGKSLLSIGTNSFHRSLPLRQGLCYPALRSSISLNTSRAAAFITLLAVLEHI